MILNVSSYWKTLFLKPQRMVPPPSWIQHIPFAFVLVQIARPKSIVELGVHSGNSFCAFCQAVEYFNSPTLCYGVDTFQGDAHSGFYDESVFCELEKHILTAYPKFAQLMRMTFDEAAEYFSDGSVDLLHIDGLHSYEAVRHDFDKWITRLSNRGIVLLHDAAVRRDNFGVWKLWDEIKNHYPSCLFRHGYGLGVLAVGEKCDQNILSLIEEVNQDVDVQYLFSEAGEKLEKSLLLREMEKIQKKLELAQQDIVSKQHHLESSQVKLESTQEELASALRELDSIQEKYDLILSQKQAILESWSWFLSSPLRKVGSILHK